MTGCKKQTLNIKNLNSVIFHSHKRKVASNFNLKILDHEHNVFKHRECKTFVNYLWELIDNNLSWKNHIDYTVLIMSKTVGIVSRLQHFLSTNILLNIYCSLIQLFISYGLTQDGAKPLNQILEEF